MSFANPTPIRLGMTGTLAGKRYRVAGRVVMGMDDAGETYYWNEFNLMGDDGESATLVYEETERGGEWRLFTLFEPEFAMSAADAAAKRVGDQLNLDGRDVRVTLVDESRVYYIEGQAPEGVEVGDIAHYFNAETSNRMLVVSWTGDEVEYYRGVTISGGAVSAAFGVRAEVTRSSVSSFLSSQASYTGPSVGGGALKFVGLFLFAAIVFAGFVSFGPKFWRAGVTKTSAPAAPLAIGGTGNLDGRTWHNLGHALVEVGQVGRLFERHEYYLLDDEQNRALLIYGLKPGEKEWFLFTPVQPLNPLSPQSAAALRVGDRVNLDGYIAPVTELFQSVIRKAETSGLPDLRNETLQFGFSAQTGSLLLLARWNENGIVCYRGKAMPTKEVVQAFGAKAGK